MEKDLIVIGGGPGGYIAAIRAAQLGAKVLLIEKDKVGGTCLHRGCIPTKALYKNAEVINTLQKADNFGLQISSSTLNMEKVLARKQEIVDRLHSGVQLLLKKHKVDVLKGKGRLAGPNLVEISDEAGSSRNIEAKYILLATGSEASFPPIIGNNLPEVITSDEILDLKKVPESLIIIGGGVIGIEFAGIFQSFGSKVTVLEFLPRILPQMDEEISKRLSLMLKKKGINIETGVKVTEIVRDEADTLTVSAEGTKGGTQQHTAELVLVATGRIANTANLGLDELGVEYDKKGIKVNSHYATSIPGIYAIGDVIGGQMLAHVASYQGTQVAENLFASSTAETAAAVPSCVFSFPEVASVGLTEEEAKQQNIPYFVGKALFGANGKALTLGESEGLIKVLARQDNKKILGVHIIGPHASDLIHEGALAVQKELTADDITETIHAHPTLAETFHEAMLKFV